MDANFTVMVKKRKEDQAIFKENAMNYEYKVNPYPLTESTVGYLARELADLAWLQLDEVLTKYPVGANIYMKILSQGKSGGKKDDSITASLVIKISDVDPATLYKTLYAELSRQANRMYNVEDYFLYITNVSILASGQGRKGGCRDGKTKNMKRDINKNCHMILIDHKSKNNNCLIQCFNHAFGVSGRELKAAKVRADLELDADDMLDIDDAMKLLEYYNERCKQNKGLVLIDQSLKIIKFDHPSIKKKDFTLEGSDDDNLVQIYFEGKHYFTYQMVTWKKCEVCGQKLLSTNDTHKCSKDMASYYNTMITKKKDMVRSTKIIEDKIDYSKVIHWDLETFQPV
ncbi:MAG: hypothetical protein P4M14_12500, partial [Gammaproteobacteria bacterium]|nr:hypothetical protein [Gammaproteobacteria bacterium]